MAKAINRVQLLRGDLRGEACPIRPPWSIPEGPFIDGCTRCDDCISICPQQIIRRGAGGFPQVDFGLGYCSFCGDCARACKQALFTLLQDASLPPWRLEVEIQSGCLSMNGVICRSCGESCEESAIQFQLQTRGRAVPRVDGDLCSGCGECVAVCPNHSIRIQPSVA